MPGLHVLHAEVWVRSAAVALESSGSVEVGIPVSGQTFESFDEPEYFPGIFSCRAQAASSILIEMSNRLRLAFQGEGYFSVERVESLFTNFQALEAGQEALRSHIILNLRRGELLIDSRQLSGGSKLVLETPFGRIITDKSVLLVQIEFDHRSTIYDFTISAMEGTARLNDLRRQSYMIYPGQRLSGAGSYFAPAIEVGEQMTSIRETFQAYFNREERLGADYIDRERLGAQLKILPPLETSATAARESEGRSGERSSKRPRIIEYAPSAAPVTPFRAEIKPPSDFQADLF